MLTRPVRHHLPPRGDRRPSPARRALPRFRLGQLGVEEGWLTEGPKGAAPTGLAAPTRATEPWPTQTFAEGLPSAPRTRVDLRRTASRRPDRTRRAGATRAAGRDLAGAL